MFKLWCAQNILFSGLAAGRKAFGRRAAFEMRPAHWVRLCECKKESHFKQLTKVDNATRAHAPKVRRRLPEISRLIRPRAAHIMRTVRQTCATNQRQTSSSKAHTHTIQTGASPPPSAQEHATSTLQLLHTLWRARPSTHTHTHRVDNVVIFMLHGDDDNGGGGDNANEEVS